MEKKINKKALISDFQDIEKKKNEDAMSDFNQSERKIYDVFKGHEDSTVTPSYPAGTLSTRYVPNKPGVQAGRMPSEEGGFYDPYTRQEYNFQAGFNMDGVEYPAYSVSMQTDLYSLAKKLKEMGFEKYSNKIFKLIK